MSEDATFDREQPTPGVWAASNFLTPAVCAVAAFTLAVVSLLGQNALAIGVGSVSEAIFDDARVTYYAGWGVAIAGQVGLVLLLARRTFDAAGRWEATLGRAAVLVSGVTLVAAVLLIIGGSMDYYPSYM